MPCVTDGQRYLERMLLKRQEGEDVAVPGQVRERRHTIAVHKCTRAKERVEGVRGFDEINKTGVKGAGK